MNEFKFIDLFAGIGGLRKAFEAEGGHCVFTSEWDRFANETYKANFRDNRDPEGDITKVDTLKFDHDVLAGFPPSHFLLQACRRRTR